MKRITGSQGKSTEALQQEELWDEESADLNPLLLSEGGSLMTLKSDDF